MNCLICNTPTAYFLEKIYSEQPFDQIMADIGPVQYYKCPNCGFTQSYTHTNLSAERWGQLNLDVHHFMEDPTAEKKGNQPPYLEQATMINLLNRNGVISTGCMLDYAAGYGTLSSLLDKYFGIELPIYDEYVKAEGDKRYVATADLTKYSAVINSAMFEHVLSRHDLDKLHALVAENGCLIIHTVVCENIPADTDWFYFRPPVHTAFHTNKSMEILMKQWGYHASVYCPAAKCWVLLKKADADLQERVNLINQELQTTYLIYKLGFVDYWKGF